MISRTTHITLPGQGPGGYAAAVKVAKMTVIENVHPGGTCSKLRDLSQGFFGLPGDNRQCFYEQ
ncbi:MAG: hypothetical protein HQ517_02295 [SAR324 cluster bacterium]|nr:hypothetical protein [SAR324 cluster bacterium]